MNPDICTIHLDIVARRFIRHKDRNYFLAAYGDLKECGSVEFKPIGKLRETDQQVKVKEAGKDKKWRLLTLEDMMSEETFRRVSNEEFKRNWQRTNDVYAA